MEGGQAGEWGKLVRGEVNERRNIVAIKLVL